MEIQVFVKYILVSLSLWTLDSFATGDGVGHIENLALNKERFKNWFKGAHTPLKDVDGKIVDFNLKNNTSEQEDVKLSAKQQSALHDIINWNIEALGAKEFEEYYNSIKKIVKNELKISQPGYEKMRYWLKKDSAIKHPELLTDYELVEAYWMLLSRAGYSNIYFSSLLVNESFYRLKVIRDYSKLKAKPDPFPEDRKSCGQILQAPFYMLNNSDRNVEFEKSGKILVAEIRYMIRTNIDNLAYPICIGVYWSEAQVEWIPWFCIEYNASERHCRVVF